MDFPSGNPAEFVLKPGEQVTKTLLEVKGLPYRQPGTSMRRMVGVGWLELRGGWRTSLRLLDKHHFDHRKQEHGLFKSRLEAIAIRLEAMVIGSNKSLVSSKVEDYS